MGPTLKLCVHTYKSQMPTCSLTTDFQNFFMDGYKEAELESVLWKPIVPWLNMWRRPPSHIYRQKNQDVLKQLLITWPCALKAQSIKFQVSIWDAPL